MLKDILSSEELESLSNALHYLVFGGEYFDEFELLFGYEPQEFADVLGHLGDTDPANQDVARAAVAAVLSPPWNPRLEESQHYWYDRDMLATLRSKLSKLLPSTRAKE